MAYNSYKNECLMGTLQQVATLVGEKKTVNGHEGSIKCKLLQNYVRHIFKTFTMLGTKGLTWLG